MIFYINIIVNLSIFTIFYSFLKNISSKFYISFKNFLNLNIRLKLDILKSAYLLNIIELTELLLYSILGFFLKKLNLYVLNIENR